MSRWTVTERSQMKNGTSGSAWIVRQPLQGVDVGLLQDVRRRDPAPQPGVEPELDHPPQAIAIEGEHAGQRLRVAPSQSLQALRDLVARVVHVGLGPRRLADAALGDC